MEWFRLGPTGATRDLWVDVTGEGVPRYGRWMSPAGLDVANTLGGSGPAALDVPVWWEPAAEHYGRRLRDLLWQTSGLGLKLVSDRMVAALRSTGAWLQVVPVDLRLRRGEPLTGYSGVLEQCHDPGPVHSYWHGRRGRDLVVSGRVLDGVRAAGLTGLEVEPVPGPFPGDSAGCRDEH